MPKARCAWPCLDEPGTERLSLVCREALWIDVACGMCHKSLPVDRLCRRLYSPAADDAAPRPSRGDGGARTAAVGHARLRAVGHSCTAASQLSGTLG
jgi:hypothetical protein